MNASTGMIWNAIGNCRGEVDQASSSSRDTTQASFTYPPPDLRGAVSNEAEAELEPVSDDDTEDVERELGGNEGAPRRVCGYLGAPHGHDGVEVTGTNTIDDARTAHPGRRR